MKGFESHPYIPNSVPEVQEEMLREIGLGSLEELHKNVPELLKLKNEMNLPKAFRSEYELKRHVERVLSKDTDCHRNLNFLGAGCWQHYVPAICDEINGKGEFLTAYGGEPYNDEGRFQSLFEYASMVAELVDMEVVNVPTMDWAQAAATTVRMAQRITNRSVVLVPEYIDAEKLKIMENYAESCLRFEKVKCDERGLIDLSDLKEKAGADTVGIYFENPGYLGVIEQNGQLIVVRMGDENPKYPVITDGVVQVEILETIGKSEEWLTEKLKEEGFEEVSNIFIAEYDKGQLNVVTY